MTDLELFERMLTKLDVTYDDLRNEYDDFNNENDPEKGRAFMFENDYRGCSPCGYSEHASMWMFDKDGKFTGIANWNYKDRPGSRFWAIEVPNPNTV